MKALLIFFRQDSCSPARLGGVYGWPLGKGFYPTFPIQYVQHLLTLKIALTSQYKAHPYSYQRSY